MLFSSAHRQSFTWLARSQCSSIQTCGLPVGGAQADLNGRCRNRWLPKIRMSGTLFALRRFCRIMIEGFPDCPAPPVVRKLPSGHMRVAGRFPWLPGRGGSRTHSHMAGPCFPALQQAGCVLPWRCGNANARDRDDATHVAGASASDVPGGLRCLVALGWWRPVPGERDAAGRLPHGDGGPCVRAGGLRSRASRLHAAQPPGLRAGRPRRVPDARGAEPASGDRTAGVPSICAAGPANPGSDRC